MLSTQIKNPTIHSSQINTNYKHKSPYTLHTPILLQQIISNDSSLHSLRLNYNIFTNIIISQLMQALLYNNNIQSIIFVDKNIHLHISLIMFAKLLECFYHLPLVSIQIGNLYLKEDYMHHILCLVEYSCGVGKACRWDLNNNNNINNNSNNSNNNDINSSNNNENENEEEIKENIEVSAPQTLTNINYNVSNVNYKIFAKLQFIDLSGNLITVEQAKWLGYMIFHPKSTLQIINISECHLGNIGVEALLKLSTTSPRIINNINNNNNNNNNNNITPIEELILRWNNITQDDSIQSLVDILENNNNIECITHIDINGNYISPNLYKTLTERAKRVLPIIKAQRNARRMNAREKYNNNLKKQEKEMKRKQNYLFSYNSALEFLLSVAEESPTYFPSLHVLASLM